MRNAFIGDKEFAVRVLNRILNRDHVAIADIHDVRKKGSNVIVGYRYRDEIFDWPIPLRKWNEILSNGKETANGS